MGCNLISGCHKCKVQVFHWRGEESDAILPFYYKHKLCAQEDLNATKSEIRFAKKYAKDYSAYLNSK